MSTDPANNRNAQWEVDRYILSDPSFDRDAFEQRMLADLALAEQVVASVADLQALSAAARLPFDVSTNPPAIAASTNPAQPASKNPIGLNTSRWAILVSAAVVLMAFSVWQLRNTPNDEQLSQIADNWVAIEGLTTAESLELITSEDQTTEIQSDAEALEQSDWLVEAAREFYLAKNEGAAG